MITESDKRKTSNLVYMDNNRANGIRINKKLKEMYKNMMIFV